MDIRLTERSFAATAVSAPDFPWLRFDSGLTIYDEAFVDGQYVGAGWSTMGRPLSRDRVWGRVAPSQQPNRLQISRWTAFSLQVDGQTLCDRWQWRGGQEQPSTRPDCREFVVTLEHSLRPIRVCVHTRLDDSSFFERWLEITNTGTAPTALAEVYPWSGKLWQNQKGCGLDGLFAWGRFGDDLWLREGQFEWVSLPQGGYHRESLNGRSGHTPPLALLRNEATQETALVSLAWSGNWKLELNALQERKTFEETFSLHARVGLAGLAPLRVLESGETVFTPAVHVGMMMGDLDQVVQAWHSHLRRSVIPVLPEGKEHYVECNHTGYTQNNQITGECMQREIEVAADVGVELFTIDAGWFGDEHGVWANLVGDWEESPILGGLKPIVEHIHSKGMKVGLWAEIERMAPSSKLAQTHPDWFIQRAGQVIPQLDLSIPEVACHVESEIGRLVEQYDLDCFRLDYNIEIGEGGDVERHGFAESTMWRYYDALYTIFDRVREKFPRLLLENCASGGARLDLGMLSRFHWTQMSDNWAPLDTIKILNGLSIALVPEQCMPLLGAIREDVSDIEFMLRIGLFTHFCVSGIFPSPEEVNDAALTKWRRTIRLYKDFVRPMLASSRLYHHTPIQRLGEAGSWVVLENVSTDSSRAYVGIWRLPQAAEDSIVVRPRGLDWARRYRVTLDNTQMTFEVSGAELSGNGLNIRIPGGMMSELLLFQAISSCE